MDLLTENTGNSRIILQITPETLLVNNLDVFELFTLVGLYSNLFENYVNEELFEKLVEKGFIESTRFQTKLSAKGLKLMRSITQINTPITKNKRVLGRKIEATEDIDYSFVDEFRSIFKGTKAGAMGTAKLVGLKLNRFMKERPEATKDVIMEAARRYLNSLNSYNYVQQADYFIYKRDPITMEESSRLSAFVDEVLANPGHQDEDWTTRLI